MKYVRPSKVIKGAKDTYEITMHTIDKLHKQITGKYMFMKVRSDGCIDWTTEEFQIYNKPGGKIVDPEWNKNSTPPKPDGFFFDDPSTWGGLMWEEIPLVDDTSEHYYDYFISFQSQHNFSISGEYAEEALIRTLVKMGTFPTAKKDETPWSIA